MFAFFPLSLFSIQNNSSLNNFIYNGQNQTRCEKKFVFLKRLEGNVAGISYRGKKKKISYKDVYKGTKARHMFL